ncbi:MAG: ribonuclease HII [Synergistaceae bacterium]
MISETRKMYIAGTDEAGRGPLAGPVVAAAAILTNEQRKILIDMGLNDSKKVSPKLRETLFIKMCEMGVLWKAQAATNTKIDDINILQASLWCMKKSVYKLPQIPSLVLVDGNKLISDFTINQKCIVKGDSRVPVIAAASIVAKVLRDKIMLRYDTLYPGYSFAKNKGYPSLEHRNKILEIGYTPIHRLTFSGVK